MPSHICLYLSGSTCLHPDCYGKECDKGDCPIPRKKEEKE